MRIMLIAAMFVMIAAACARGQSSGPVLSAYESLPVAREEPAPEPIREPPPETTIAGVSDANVELASCQIELSNYDVNYDDVACGDVNCGDAVLEPLGADSFWFGSLELTMFTPSIAGLASDATPDGFVAPRGTIGWESSRHLGVRGRFWGATGDAYQDFGDGPIDLDVRPTRFDFDVYRRFLFDDSSLLVGGGVSAAEMRIDFDDYASVRDRGAGVQFIVEGRHRLTRSSVAETTLFARGRWAGLTGAWESNDWDEGDSHIDILEAAFGVEWRRQFKTADLILQASMESQSWDVANRGNVDFIGSVFSIGFAR